MYGYSESKATHVYNQIVARGRQGEVNPKLHELPEVTWVWNFLMDTGAKLSNFGDIGRLDEADKRKYDSYVSDIQWLLCETFAHVAALRCDDLDLSKSTEFINQLGQIKAAAAAAATPGVPWCLTPLEVVTECRKLLESSDYQDVYQRERVRRARIFCDASVKLLAMDGLYESLEFQQIITEAEQTLDYKGTEDAEENGAEGDDEDVTDMAARYTGLGRDLLLDDDDDNDDDNEGNTTGGNADSSQNAERQSNKKKKKHIKISKEEEEELKRKRKGEREMTRKKVKDAEEKWRKERMEAEGARDDIWDDYEESFMSSQEGVYVYGPPTSTLKFIKYNMGLRAGFVKPQFLIWGREMGTLHIQYSLKDFTVKEKNRLIKILRLEYPADIFGVDVNGPDFNELFNTTVDGLRANGGKFDEILSYMPLMLAKATPFQIVLASRTDDAWRLRVKNSKKQKEALDDEKIKAKQREYLAERLKKVLALKKWIMSENVDDVTDTHLPTLIATFESSIHKELVGTNYASDDDYNVLAALMYLSSIHTQYLPSIALLCKCGMNATSAAGLVLAASGGLSALQLEANIMKMISETIRHSGTLQDATGSQTMDLDEAHLHGAGAQGASSSSSSSQQLPSDPKKGDLVQVTIHVARPMDSEDWLAKEKLRFSAMVLRRHGEDHVKVSNDLLKSINRFVHKINKEYKKHHHGSAGKENDIKARLVRDPGGCINEAALCKISRRVVIHQDVLQMLMQCYEARCDVEAEACNGFEKNMHILRAENLISYWENTLSKQIKEVQEKQEQDRRASSLPGFEDFKPIAKSRVDTEQMISLVPNSMRHFDFVWINQTCAAFSNISGVRYLTVARLVEKEAESWCQRKYTRQAFNAIVTDLLRVRHYTGFAGGILESDERVKETTKGADFAESGGGNAAGHTQVNFQKTLKNEIDKAFKKFGKILTKGVSDLESAWMQYVDIKRNPMHRNDTKRQAFTNAFFDHAMRYITEGPDYFEYGDDVYNDDRIPEYNETRYLHERLHVERAGVLWAETKDGYAFTCALDSAVQMFYDNVKGTIKEHVKLDDQTFRQEVMQKYCFRRNVKAVKSILDSYWKIHTLTKIINASTVFSEGRELSYDVSSLLNAVDTVHDVLKRIKKRESQGIPALLWYARAAHLLAMDDSTNSYLWEQSDWQDLQKPLKNAEEWLGTAISTHDRNYQRFKRRVRRNELGRLGADQILDEVLPSLRSYYKDASQEKIKTIEHALAELGQYTDDYNEIFNMSHNERADLVAALQAQLKEMVDSGNKDVQKMEKMSAEARVRLMKRHVRKLIKMRQEIEHVEQGIAERERVLNQDAEMPVKERDRLTKICDRKRAKLQLLRTNIDEYAPHVSRWADVLRRLQKIEVAKMDDDASTSYRLYLANNRVDYEADLEAEREIHTGLSNDETGTNQAMQFLEAEYQEAIKKDEKRETFLPSISYEDGRLLFIAVRHPSFLPFIQGRTRNPFYTESPARGLLLQQQQNQGTGGEGLQQEQQGDRMEIDGEDSDEGEYEKDGESESDEREEERVTIRDEKTINEMFPEKVKELQKIAKDNEFMGIRDKLVLFASALQECHMEIQVYEMLNNDLKCLKTREGKFEQLQLPDEQQRDFKQRMFYGEKEDQVPLLLEMYICEMKYRKDVHEDILSLEKSVFEPMTDLRLLMVAEDLWQRYSSNQENRNNYHTLKMLRRLIDYIEVHIRVENGAPLTWVEGYTAKLSSAVKYICRKDVFLEKALAFCYQNFRALKQTIKRTKKREDVVKTLVDEYLASLSVNMYSWMIARRKSFELSVLQKMHLRDFSDQDDMQFFTIFVHQYSEQACQRHSAVSGALVDCMCDDVGVKRAFIFATNGRDILHFTRQEAGEIVREYAEYLGGFLESVQTMRDYCETSIANLSEKLEGHSYLDSFHMLSTDSFDVRNMFSDIRTEYGHAHNRSVIPAVKTQSRITADLLLQLKELCQKTLAKIDDFRDGPAFHTQLRDDDNEDVGGEQ